MKKRFVAYALITKRMLKEKKELGNGRSKKKHFTERV